MLTVYPAIFYKERSGAYSVVFPDLNHLSTCGDELASAAQNAVDCLAGYLYDEKLAGNAYPPATPLESVDVHAEDDDDDDYINSFVEAVSVDVDAYAMEHFSKPVRKNVTIPKWLNDTAISRGVNFSAVLQNALMAELGISRAENQRQPN